MSGLTSTGTFVRFFLRRDRLPLLYWTLGGLLLYVTQAAGSDSTYATQAELDQAAATMQDNPALIAMAGPARALDTIGGQVAWQVAAFGAVLAGLMSMFLVGRHTRAEEESGRDELVRSGVVGRYAPFAATAVVVTFANVLVGAVAALGLIAYRLPTAGSLALGVAFTVSGLAFAGIALLAAQLTESTRAMYGLTGAVIALAYVLRGVGDVGNGVASWFSPIGWGQAMRAYADEIWWPALLAIAFAAAVTLVALRLLGLRDVGAGMLPPRPGPARAGDDLQGAFGLAWRLQRGALLGWSAGLLLIGVSYGSLGTDIDEVMGSGGTDIVAQTGGDLVDSFYATMAVLTALFGAAYAVQAALRVRGEESAGRVESLLATSLPRHRWLWSHTVIVLLGTALVVGLGGLGTGGMYAIMSGDSSQVLRLLGASLVHVPAAWAIAGVTVALVGLTPRFATAAWAAVGFCVIVLMFGSVLDLPGWLMDVSPFEHSPMVPVAEFDAVPVVVVTVIAGLLLAAGTVGLRRRDLQSA